MKNLLSISKLILLVCCFAASTNLSGQVLYDNGPLVNCPGCGVGGADESAAQDVTLGHLTWGWGHQVAFSRTIADDFTIPAGSPWDITTMTFFAYQTNSTTLSTITEVRVRIWDGLPGAVGSSVIYGDLTTNRLASTTWSGIYRVYESTSGGNTQRPIMTNVVGINTILNPGTYWVEWQADGSAAFSGPWAPSITINGVE